MKADIKFRREVVSSKGVPSKIAKKLNLTVSVVERRLWSQSNAAWFLKILKDKPEWGASFDFTLNDEDRHFRDVVLKNFGNGCLVADTLGISTALVSRTLWTPKHAEWWIETKARFTKKTPAFEEPEEPVIDIDIGIPEKFKRAEPERTELAELKADIEAAFASLDRVSSLLLKHEQRLNEIERLR